MDRSVTKKLKISGMTCVNCKKRIEKALKATKGVMSADIDFPTSILTVTYNSDTDIKTIEGIIEDLGYGTSMPENDHGDKYYVAKTLLVILAVYFIMSRFGVTNIFNAFPEASAGMGYGMLFVIGLLTSVHCIAMCGGINLSQCTAYALGAAHCGRYASFRPSFLYNFGRVLSYTVIGGLVGALGSVVSFSGAGKGIVAVVAGVFMVIMGLNMLDVSPWLKRVSLQIPAVLRVKISEQKSGKGPFYVGLLNGLMPCGPLQAMQIYALSTGDPVKGALSMMIFSLGTVPLMFGLGTISSVLTKKYRGRMMKTSAVLVVILGIFMFSNGMALSGYAMPRIFSSSATVAAGTGEGGTAELKEGVQVVRTELSPWGYPPIAVQAGIPVRWNLYADRSAINGCNNRIFIPDLGVEKKLEPGDNIIEFTPKKKGTIPFSCWMGMIRSQINVYDDIKDKPKALPGGSGSIQQRQLGSSCCSGN
ncbi:MAG: sulfite exporter TauE/SafE family protein [Synergistaceae bacterium]|nr:sulfite exporter TauE/SafE family protein [Synergistaceae bacterium]MDD3672840.1 sulfite exporter TauE/SafE family protein [Synergistaceae bacterium]